MAMESNSQWDQKVGVNRLSSLGDVPPPSGPHGPFMDVGVPMDDWLYDLHQHANEMIEPELIDDRWNLWRQTREDVRDAPAWMTLTPHPDLRSYEKFLIKDLELDNRALKPFVTLVRRSDLGYSEACRVLYHGLKDKMNIGDPRYDRGPDGKDRDPAAHSKWFKGAADEALRALDNPQAWNGPRLHKGPKGWSKGKEPQGPHGTSSSSSASTNAWASYSGNLVPPSQEHCASSSSSSASPAYRTGWR